MNMELHIRDPRLLTHGQQVIACIDGCMVEGEICIDSDKAVFLLHNSLRHKGAHPIDGGSSKYLFSWWFAYLSDSTYMFCDYVINRRAKKWNHQ